MPGRDAWDLTEETPREPGDGEVLVKVLMLSLDPAMRGWMNDVPSYIPPVGIGEVMRAIGVGEVVASRYGGRSGGGYAAGPFRPQGDATPRGEAPTPVAGRAGPPPP